jgi:DNA-binding MurR/RpiR family transcriptional regulator
MHFITGMPSKEAAKKKRPKRGGNGREEPLFQGGRRSNMPAIESVDRLKQAFPHLSPQLKIAARFALDSPGDIALLSMRSAASRAGVQPATMSRLVRELGFQSYREFQEPFRESLRAGGVGYAARARQMRGGPSSATVSQLLEGSSSTALANIGKTFADLRGEDFEGAVEMLAAARRIYVIGMRKCYPLAFYFHYACRMFDEKVTLIDGRVSTFADQLGGIGKGDVLLTIGYDRYTWETVNAARRAAGAGADIIAITDSNVSPLGQDAIFTFVVANSSSSFFRSLVAAQALIETMVAALVAHRGDGAVEALSLTEQRLENFGVYWSDSTSKRGAQ